MNSSPMRFKHLLAVGVPAGVVGGFVTGIGARGIMALAAVGSDLRLQCSLSGMLLLLGIFTAGGAVLGPLFLWLCDLAPGPIAARGLFFGLVFILSTNVPLRLLQCFDQRGLPDVMALLLTALTAALLPIYGAATGLAVKPIEWLLAPTD